MKLTCGRLALGASLFLTSLMVTATSTAQAATVVSGSDSYEITTVQGTYNNLSGLLQSQPWWSDTALASSFAQQINNSLGIPNIPENFNTNAPNNEGPYFSYGANSITAFVYNWDNDRAEVEPDTKHNFLDRELVWAITDQPQVTPQAASAVPPVGAVPTPALLPGLLGFGVSLMGRKRQQVLADN